MKETNQLLSAITGIANNLMVGGLDNKAKSKNEERFWKTLCQRLTEVLETVGKENSEGDWRKLYDKYVKQEKSYDFLLNVKKLGSATESERKMILEAFQLIVNEKEIIEDSNNEQIAELNEEISELKFQLSMYTDNTIAQDLIAKNKSLEAQVESLTEQLKLANSGENLQELVEFMRKWKKPKDNSKKEIKNERIRELHDMGYNSYRIKKQLETEGVKCSLQTVINRLDKMNLK